MIQIGNRVILIWEEIPDETSIYYGLVSDRELELLKLANNTFINSVNHPMPKELESLCYDKDGNFTLPNRFNLEKIDTPRSVFGVILIMGFLL